MALLEDRDAAMTTTPHLQGKGHFATLHGQLGLATIALTASSLLLGGLSFRSFGLVRLVPGRLLASVKASHRLVGWFAWGLSLTTSATGLLHPVAYKVSPCFHPMCRAIHHGSPLLHLFVRAEPGDASPPCEPGRRRRPSLCHRPRRLLETLVGRGGKDEALPRYWRQGRGLVDIKSYCTDAFLSPLQARTHAKGTGHHCRW